LGLIPFGFQQFSTVADRYFYFAMLGPALALAWLVSRERAGVLRAVSVVVLLLLCAATSVQVLYWQNTRSLFGRVLDINPDSYYAHQTMGNIAAAEENHDAAVRHYTDALRINPNSWVTHSQLGFALEAIGNRAEAVEHWTQAVKLDPTYEPARRALEQVRQQQKQQQQKRAPARAR
jgi:tetratricopeptide (TPR) repeat protein